MGDKGQGQCASRIPLPLAVLHKPQFTVLTFAAFFIRTASVRTSYA
jgi:hypothetical protein